MAMKPGVMVGLVAAAGAGLYFATRPKEASAAPPTAPSPPIVPAVLSPSVLPSVVPPPPPPSAIPTDIPEPFRSYVLTTLQNPALGPTDLEAAATYLEGLGLPQAAAILRARAAVLRTAAASTPPSPLPTALSGVRYRSSPTAQWTVTALAGDSPALIARKVTGNERNYPELVTLNTSVPGADGVPHGNNGLPVPQYNFLRLHPGDRLQVPRSWNIYVDEAGKSTGGLVLPERPAPVVAGAFPFSMRGYQ